MGCYFPFIKAVVLSEVSLQPVSFSVSGEVMVARSS